MGLVSVANRNGFTFSATGAPGNSIIMPGLVLPVATVDIMFEIDIFCDCNTTDS